MSARGLEEMIGYNNTSMIDLNRSQPENLLVENTPESNVNHSAFPPSLK